MMKAFDSLGHWQYWWTRQRLENSWSMYQALKRVMQRHKLDVIEMPECGAEGALINSWVSTPTIVRFHSPSRLIMPYYDVRSADMRMCSWIEQHAIQNATALTSCSQFLSDEVQTKMGVRKPIEVIPNGIDLDLFDHEPLVDVLGKYGLPRDKPIILFAGRMEHRKGIHLCGKIAQEILRRHDVAMVFAGQDLFGHMENTILPSLAKHELRGTMHYIGKVDHQEVRSLVRTVNIFLLPSLWENCPYSCLEAMAAGRAIVSSDQGGMPELIRDGHNGLLAEAGVPEAFVAQLGRMIDDESLRTRLGAAARRTIEQQYTDHRIAKLSAELYSECIDRSKAGMSSGAISFGNRWLNHRGLSK
jgi:glycogen synthase